MSIESTCSGCGKNLSVADEHAGKQARCPACGQIYTVPNPFSEAAEQASSADASPYAGPTSAEDGPFPNAAVQYPPNPSRANDQYWMQASDGNIYGPVDQPSLQRWFYEGRVGPGYKIRQGADAPWQVAELFQPSHAPPSGTARPNPYSDTIPYRASGQGPLYRYPKSDQSGLILAMGIIGFFFCPCAIIAWVMGHSALKDIAAGRADPTNKSMVQVGYYLGIASVAMSVLCGGFYFLAVAIAVVSGANM